MTDAAVWVLVALAALLVGAVIPVLVQLRRSLKAVEETLQSTGRRVNETLDRVNRAADSVEQGASRLSGLLESLGALGDMLGSVRSSLGAVTTFGSIFGGSILAALGMTSKSGSTSPDKAEPPAPKEKAE